MKTTIERESPTKLRLEIEADPAEVAPLYEKTMKRLAAEVNIPGFRKGKVPRSLLETRLGPEAIREEVLKDALPVLYAQAAQAESLRPITLPDLDVVEYAQGEPLSFTATIEVRPEVTLPEYRGLEVEFGETAPTEEEITQQLEHLRERFGTLEPVGRNTIKGDYVTIDMQASRHGEPIPEASATDLLYELGSGGYVPELDTELEGKRAGDILKFNASLPPSMGDLGGQEVTFSVIVKQVQMKRLPDLDDEFAKTASEFETLDELRVDIVERIKVVKAAQAEDELRNRLLETLIERTDLHLPESLVAAETQARLVRLGRDLQQNNITIARYLEATGTSEQELLSMYKEAAEKAVGADLVIEAVAASEGFQVGGTEIDDEVERLAQLMDTPADGLRDQLEESGRVEILAGDILRRKVLDFLKEHANISRASPDESAD